MAFFSSKVGSSCQDFHTMAKEFHSSELYLSGTEFPDHETIRPLKFKNSIAGFRVGSLQQMLHFMDSFKNASLSSSTNSEISPKTFDFISLDEKGTRNPRNVFPTV